MVLGRGWASVRVHGPEETGKQLPVAMLRELADGLIMKMAGSVDGARWTGQRQGTLVHGEHAATPGTYPIGSGPELFVHCQCVP